MRKLMMTTAVAVAMATPIAAQDAADNFTTEWSAGDFYGSELIGKRLYVSEADVDSDEGWTEDARTEWEDVGEIEDLLIGEDGEVKAVLLDIGGFLGIGEKRIAANMDELDFVRENDDADEYFVVMQGNAAMLDSAPEYAERDMDAAMTESDGVTGDSMDGTPMAADERRWAAPQLGDDYNDYETLAKADLTADMLEGADVYGPDREDIGDVTNLVLSDSGEVKQVVLDVGGFLGLGEHRIAVDFEEIRVVRDPEYGTVEVHVDATQEQLESRPEYDG